MKRERFILLALALVGGIVLIGLASFFHDGLSARATPTFLERIMARDARHLVIPSAAKALKNPVPASSENLREGRVHFADHCAICHGNDGSGDTMIGRGLYPKPPDLRLPETQKLSDGELFWAIENGVRFTGMPAFSSPGMQDESWKLVDFIRHMPQLTESERMQMEEDNPKSPADKQEEKQEDDFLNGTTPAPKPESHHPH